jgi:glycosyltransferase involved in cell wall biosynthesis
VKNINTLLSLCIPTYNRFEVLDKAIASIVSQKIYSTNDIEIVICDNASTDKTEEIVKKYSSKYSNIYYYKNTTNIHDRNFPTVLNYAHGEFRKLLNDTLIVKDGSLETLYNVVKQFSKEKPILLFKNNNNKNNKLKNRTKLYFFKTDSREKALKNISFRMNWIGTLGVWSDDLKNIDTTEKYCNTKLWQVEAILENMQFKNNIVIIENECFLTQTKMKKSIDYSYFTIFYKNYIDICRRNIEILKLSNKVFLQLKKDLLNNFFAKFFVENKYNVMNNNCNENIQVLFDDLKNEYKRCEWFVFKMKLLEYNIYYILKNKKIKIINRVKRFLGLSEEISLKTYIQKKYFNKN